MPFDGFLNKQNIFDSPVNGSGQSIFTGYGQTGIACPNQHACTLYVQRRSRITRIARIVDVLYMFAHQKHCANCALELTKL